MENGVNLGALKWVCGLLIGLSLGASELQRAPSDSDILSEALPPGTTVPAEWSATGAPTSEVQGNRVAIFRDSNMTSPVTEGL